MYYIKTPIILAVAYCIIASYDVLYAMENNKGTIYITEVTKDHNRTKKIVENSLKYNNQEEHHSVLVNFITKKNLTLDSVNIKNSLKDPKFQKMITNISENECKNPAKLQKFLLHANKFNYFIEGTQEHTWNLVNTMIMNPIDINNINNTLKSQFEILFENTDFDCNKIIRDRPDNNTMVSYTIFAELLMMLSENKKIDSLPLVEQWLNQGADSNIMSEAKSIIENQKVKYQLDTPFKIAIGLLSQNNIQCTDPKKMITLFLEKKADPNIECYDIVNGTLTTPFKAFINALKEKTIVLPDNDRTELIKLFLKSGADEQVLKKANFFNY